MVDGIFFINHALSVNQLSVYNTEKRFEQTISTIDSIDKYCPSNIKYMFDSSPNIPQDEHFTELNRRGVKILYVGQEENIKKFSNYGQRSIAECLAFQIFLNWFKDQNVESKRIYKLSGRYQINENFILNEPSHKDAFVFSTALDSWLPKDRQTKAGVDKLYRLRFWHMDYSCLNTFNLMMPNILEDCGKYGIDVEHSYYKHLHMRHVVEVDKIGVCGNIAPTGEYIDE